jgi:hypothetical protein
LFFLLCSDIATLFYATYKETEEKCAIGSLIAGLVAAGYSLKGEATSSPITGTSGKKRNLSGSGEVLAFSLILSSVAGTCQL